MFGLDFQKSKLFIEVFITNFMFHLEKKRTTKELKEIAKEARRSFEERKIKSSLLEELYSKYSPIQDITLFISRAIDSFPSSNCGVASVYLHHILGEGEVVQGKYAGNNHTFLMIGSKVIDITADQYEGPTVYVGPIKTPWKRN